MTAVLLMQIQNIVKHQTKRKFHCLINFNTRHTLFSFKKGKDLRFQEALMIKNRNKKKQIIENRKTVKQSHANLFLKIIN